jgi:hypothetical protein
LKNRWIGSPSLMDAGISAIRDVDVAPKLPKNATDARVLRHGRLVDQIPARNLIHDCLETTASRTH